jgi:hypothetical protein
MTAPKVTELIQNGNPIGKQAVDRQSAPPTTAAHS